MINTSKIKDSIKQILMKDESISSVLDLNIDLDYTVFNENSYVIRFTTFEKNGWSDLKYKTIKLTQVLFCLTD